MSRRRLLTFRYRRKSSIWYRGSGAATSSPASWSATTSASSRTSATASPSCNRGAWSSCSMSKRCAGAKLKSPTRKNSSPPAAVSRGPWDRGRCPHPACRPPSPILRTGEGKTFKNYRPLPSCVAKRSRMGEGARRAGEGSMMKMQLWVPAFAGMTEEGALALGVKKV